MILIMIILGAVALMLAWFAGAVALAFWPGHEGYRAGRVQHMTYSPGYELSAFQNALRVFAYWTRAHPRKDPTDHPTDS